MKIFHVSIYIETSIKGPKVTRAAGEWLAEFVTSSRIPVTRSGIIIKEKTSENALTLELLRDALSILTKTCSIRLNTKCGHILQALGNGWTEQWKKNGWKKAGGKELANAELWKEVSGLMEHHLIDIDSGWHEYQDVMLRDIKRKMSDAERNI